jgi:hypothetical protein
MLTRRSGVKVRLGRSAAWCPSLQSCIQPLQIPRHELAILPQQLAVEPDFAAAVVGPLDEHQVPVDAAGVAVVGDVVGLAGREVEAAADFFVEQRVA